MPGPIAATFAALVGRPLIAATLRVGMIAQAAGQSIRAASLIAGRTAAPAAESVVARGPLSALTRGRTAAAKLPPTREVLRSALGAARQPPPARGGVIQRITQMISTNIQARAGGPQQASDPQQAARQLANMLGNDPISRATADDWADRQSASREHAEAARAEAAAVHTEEFAGSVGKAVLAVNGLAGATLAAGKGLSVFAHSRMAGMQNLRMFNGGIATDFIRLEQQRIQLDRRKAQNVAATSGMLADSLQRLNEAAAPLESTMTNVGNVMGTVGAEMVTIALNLGNAVGEQVRAVAEMVPQLKAALREFDEFLKRQRGHAEPGMMFLKQGAMGAFRNQEPHQPLPK